MLLMKALFWGGAINLSCLSAHVMRTLPVPVFAACPLPKYRTGNLSLLPKHHGPAPSPPPAPSLLHPCLWHLFLVSTTFCLSPFLSLMFGIAFQNTCVMSHSNLSHFPGSLWPPRPLAVLQPSLQLNACSRNSHTFFPCLSLPPVSSALQVLSPSVNSKLLRAECCYYII